MEVTLVHPNDKDTKVVATHPIQVVAYKNQGFLEESELADAQAAEATADEAPQNDEELAKLKAENKALKSENTKLKNKLEKVSTETEPAPEGDESENKQEGEETK